MPDVDATGKIDNAARLGLAAPDFYKAATIARPFDGNYHLGQDFVLAQGGLAGPLQEMCQGYFPPPICTKQHQRRIRGQKRRTASAAGEAAAMLPPKVALLRICSQLI